MSRLPIILVASYAALIWIVDVIGTAFTVPDAGWLALTFAVMPVKVGAQVGLVLLFVQAVRCVRLKRDAAMLGVWFLAAGWALVLLFASLRLQLRFALVNDAARYVMTDDTGEGEIGAAEWLVRWNRGEILALEMGAMALLAFIAACCAWFGRRRPAIATAVWLAVSAVVIGLHVGGFGLVLWDYDIFFYDIFSGGLLTDWSIPLAAPSPASEVSSATMLVIGIALWLFAKARTRRV